MIFSLSSRFHGGVSGGFEALNLRTEQNVEVLETFIPGYDNDGGFDKLNLQIKSPPDIWGAFRYTI